MNEDGVLFVPQEEAERAVEHGLEALDSESETIERIENGESVAELSGANKLVEELKSD